MSNNNQTNKQDSSNLSPIFTLPPSALTSVPPPSAAAAMYQSYMQAATMYAFQQQQFFQQMFSVPPPPLPNNTNIPIRPATVTYPSSSNTGTGFDGGMCHLIFRLKWPDIHLR